MTAAAASLRPVAGSPSGLMRLLSEWLAAESPPPLAVRTSGSTGAPKNVLLSTRAVQASADATLSRLGGPGQWVLALPPNYVAGLQVLVRSLLAGVPPVVVEEHSRLPAAVERVHSPRGYLACVPAQLHRWLAADDTIEALRRLDAVLVGGGGLSDALLDRASVHNVRVVTSYGMSETCGGCVYDGRPLDGVAVAIGEAGQVRLSGPMLFDGYDGRPDLTAQVLVDDWLLTPDIGELDEAGRLVVTGRADDLVKSGGVTVPLSAVERRVSAMPGVDEVAVYAAPDDEWGCRVVAVVVAAEQLELAAVRDFVSAEHPRAWAPREVRVVERLPRLASGKVDRLRLADLADGAAR